MPSKLFGKIPAAAGSVTFNAPGEWTVPPGVNYVNIQGKGAAGNPGTDAINGAGGEGGVILVPANPGNPGNGGGGGGGGGGFFNKGNETAPQFFGYNTDGAITDSPSGQPGQPGTPSATHTADQSTGGRAGNGGPSPAYRVLMSNQYVGPLYQYYYTPGSAGNPGQNGNAGNSGNEGFIRAAISGYPSVDGEVGNPGQASSVSKKSGGSDLPFQPRTYPGGQAGAGGIKGNDGQAGNAASMNAGLGGNSGFGGQGGGGGFGSGGPNPHLSPPAIMQPGYGGAAGVTPGTNFPLNANAGAQGSTGQAPPGGNTFIPHTVASSGGGNGGVGGLGGSKPSYQGSAGGGGGGGAAGQAGRSAQNQPGNRGAAGTGATAGEPGAAAVFVQNSLINVVDNDILEISVGDGTIKGQVIISWTAQ